MKSLLLGRPIGSLGSVAPGPITFRGNSRLRKSYIFDGGGEVESEGRDTVEALGERWCGGGG